MDPITQTYQAIWAALNASSTFAAIVKPGNRIDLTAAAFDKLKDDVQPADLPQALLVQGAFRLEPFGANSRVVSLVQEYELLAAFDSLSVAPVNALTWAAGLALVSAGPTLGLKFVRGWTLGSGRDDPLGRLPFTTKLRNWGSLLAISVSMDFDRAGVGMTG